MNPVPREGGDFFPLTIEYEEKFYAAGKILGSRFIKRETRPSEEAILAGRLIDRSLRPRFDLRMRNEVQIVVTVLSIDDQNDPDVPALLASSLALSLSAIPWNGPVACIRVGRKNGAFILNPTYEERAEAELDAAVSGTKERINMIEAGANEVTESDFGNATEWGHKFIKELVEFQEKIIAENPRGKSEIPLIKPAEELRHLMKKEFSAKVEETLYVKDKKARAEGQKGVREEWLKRAAELFPEKFQKTAADFLFEEEINEIVHRRIIEKGERPDGRRPDELRELAATVGILPRVHGSGMFMRGETHVLSTLTLGAPGDEQIVEGMEIRTKKHFLHHYNFPPFSTGETKPMRGPGRREIGHGALAGRALMDAGVPIKKAAGGAAMGLMLNEKGAYRVLTDIQGPEDHHGDMDFKAAGTRDGITAVQMDVKIAGLTPEMLHDVLEQARKSRLQILDLMDSVISKPRPELSPWAPRVNIIKINPEKIGALIGPGGKVINEIIAQTGAQIDIEDDGTVFITSPAEEGMKKALSLIKQITRELKAGELLEGRVSRILDFGAMVEVGPRQDGLIHISELAPWHVERVTDIVKLGEVVPVKVKNIDEQGRVNLSLKDVPGRYSEEEIARGREEIKSRDAFSAPAKRHGPRRR